MLAKNIGRVTKRSSAKTVQVALEVVKKRPVYKKTYRQVKTCLAHDPSDALSVGQKVILKPSRPFSRRKRWLAIPLII